MAILEHGENDHGSGCDVEVLILTLPDLGIFLLVHQKDSEGVDKAACRFNEHLYLPEQSFQIRQYKYHHFSSPFNISIYHFH